MRMFAVGILLCSTQFALAVDHAAALKEYLTDDVVAIAYLDLSAIDTLGVLEWAEELGIITAEERDEAAEITLAVQGRLDRLVASGASHLYLLFRVTDVGYGGPSWVVPIAESGDPDEALRLILGGRPDKWNLEAEVVDGTVLGGTTTEQLEHLKNTRPEAPRDLSDAWSALGQGDCGLLIFGDSDSRRVVREMFPPLSEPFVALNGELLANGLLWGGISLKLSPQPRAEIVLETQNENVATTVAEVITSGLALAKLALPGKQELIEALARAFQPQVAGVRVGIALDELTGDIDLLTQLLSPPVRAARQAMQRNQRMNQFKNIALALQNYHSARKAFPARANFDDNGKPLLSWRVLILPYLGDGRLYKQFHLDEPWDSEHNRTLIEKMPAIYADPDSALRRINAEGKTTFVVPVGEGTLFDGPEGRTIKQITDGTSNTIQFVEVVPERAVIWTKPDDWEVDFADPLSGVRRSDRESFNAARCDGSVHTISNSIDEEMMRGLLTIAGYDRVP